MTHLELSKGIFTIRELKKFLESEGYVVVKIKNGNDMDYYAFKDNKTYRIGIYWETGVSVFEENIDDYKDVLKELIIKAFNKRGIAF